MLIQDSILDDGQTETRQIIHIGSTSQIWLHQDLAGTGPSNVSNHVFSAHYDMKIPYTGLCKKRVIVVHSVSVQALQQDC